VNPPLLKALAASVPTCVLLLGSAVMFVREKRAWSVLQLLGAAGLVVVVLTHLCEALQLFPLMHWGEESSPGHYLGLSSALLGVTLFPVGYLLHALAMRRTLYTSAFRPTVVLITAPSDFARTCPHCSLRRHDRAELGQNVPDRDWDRVGAV
jgi:hypothetical protein